MVVTIDFVLRSRLITIIIKRQLVVLLLLLLEESPQFIFIARPINADCKGTLEILSKGDHLKCNMFIDP